MSKKLKKSLIKDLEIGQIIEVFVADRFRREFGWDLYSKTKYKIENINPDYIRGRNVDYECEIIKIEQSDIDCGRIYFNCLKS